MNRSHAAALAVVSLLVAARPAPGDEVLYNGIRLPAKWPPAVTIGPEPMPVPYLKAPPEVIPIDVGRQLFVDDFLVEKTDLARTYHRAEYHPATPVLRPDTPSEKASAPNPCDLRARRPARRRRRTTPPPPVRRRRT